MAEQNCGASVQACALRVAVLEQDGVPLPGAGNLYVTDQMSKLDVTPVYYKGVDIQVPNACGTLAVNYKARDVLQRLEFALDLPVWDPELESMLTGGEKFTSGGFTVGGSLPGVGAIGAPYGVSLELWTKHIVNGDLDGINPYIRWVIPRSYWQHDKQSFDNAAMPRSFTGWSTENPNWFNGPANDWTFASDRSMAYALAKTIPAAQCGATTLTAS